MTFPTRIDLDQHNATPLYLQVADAIRSIIHQNALTPGQALPSERELMNITGTSRVTIRKALKQLIGESLLHRRRGAGTFIAAGREQSGDALIGFTDDTLSRGESSGTVWLIKARALASEDEARQLKLNVGDPVVRFGRVRLADDQPLAIEHAVLPAHLSPEPDDVQNSLYEALSLIGNRPQSGIQKLRASLASPVEASLLTIKENSEVLRIERNTYLADGTPLEYTHSVYRGDKYVFVSRLQQ